MKRAWISLKAPEGVGRLRRGFLSTNSTGLLHPLSVDGHSVFFWERRSYEEMLFSSVATRDMVDAGNNGDDAAGQGQAMDSGESGREVRARGGPGGPYVPMPTGRRGWRETIAHYTSYGVSLMWVSFVQRRKMMRVREGDWKGTGMTRSLQYL